MRRIDEQQSARLKKKEALERKGIDPYPARSSRTHSLAEAHEQFETLSSQKTEIIVAGRILQVRSHGGSTFLTISDGDTQFQIYLKKDELGEDAYAQWVELIDIGDFFEYTGTLFLTKKQEQTLLASRARILTKSLLPIPEQYYGLKDTETRLRKRYLDLLLHKETRQLFKKKNRFWQTIRTFLLERHFLEVETPVLERIPGGADAKPFSTHYDALGEDRYLRISLELPLKRLLVGGLERVFEIGRIFRNEGISPEHLQDYTQMECYWAYADYEDLMALMKELYTHIAEEVHGTTRVQSRGKTIDFRGEWKRYDYFVEFTKQVGLSLENASDKELRAKAKSSGIELDDHAGKGKLIDALYKKFVRPTLIDPGFLIDPPVEVEPLAKRHAQKPNRVQRMQIMAWGTELGKGFSELNDPIDQRKRFEEQMKLREAGDDEAQRLDEDFLEALEYGMPPAAGFGMSERFFAYLMDKPVRETVLFPPLRKESSEEKDHDRIS